MRFKIGDKVKTSHDIGKVVWIKPRKIPQDGNIDLPLINGPDWDMGVMIPNSPDCSFPFFIYWEQAEAAELIE